MFRAVVILVVVAISSVRGQQRQRFLRGQGQQMFQSQSGLGGELRRQELIAQRIQAIDRRIAELGEPLSPAMEPLMMAATSATGSNPFTSALSGLSAALSHPPHPPNLSFDEMVEEHKVRKLGDPHTAAVIATIGVALFAAAFALPHLTGHENKDLSFLSLFTGNGGFDARDVPRRQRRSSFVWETARDWGMDQCGQMAVCEAHARYDNYGLVALPLTLFFPGDIDRSSGQPTSIWQEAAVRGKAREECGDTYNCYVNPMLIAKFLWTLLFESV